MKNLTRVFVLVLALSGISAAYSNMTVQDPANAVTSLKTSAFPIPTCPWNDPNACGIAGPSPNVVQK